MRKEVSTPEPELNVEAKPKGHGRCPQCNHMRAGHTERGCLLCECSTAFGRDELGRSVKITTHDIADGLDNGQITVGTAEAMILALIQQVSDQRVREFSERVDAELYRVFVVGGGKFNKDIYRMDKQVIDQTLADYLSHKEAGK